MRTWVAAAAAALLGVVFVVAIRIPGETLRWDAAGLKITHVGTRA